MFKALWRYQNNDAYYPEQSDDYLKVITFIDKLKPQYDDIINSEAENDITYLVNKITIQATILGIESEQKYDEKVNELSVEKAFENNLALDRWAKLRQDAKQNRAPLVACLHEQLGSMQGDRGHKLFAFDKLRLNQIISRNEGTDPKELLDLNLPDEVTQHLKNINKKSDIERTSGSAAKIVVRMCDKIEELLGDNFNQANFKTQADLLIYELQKINGGYPEEDFPHIKISKELEWFAFLELSNLRKAMDSLRSTNIDTEPSHTILAYLAKINVNDVEKLEAFLIDWEKFLSVSQTNVERASGSLELDPQESEQEFKNILKTTLVNLKEVANFSEIVE